MSKRLLLVGILTSLLLTYRVSIAQTRTPLSCGDVIEAELTSSEPQHDYVVRVSAGTVVEMTIEPIGTGLNPFVKWRDAAGNQFETYNQGEAGVAEQIIDLVISSHNPIVQVSGDHPTSTGYSSSNARGSIGAYILSFGCTLRNGTVIEPGEVVNTNSPQSHNNADQVVAQLPADFVGFPGLASVSFADAAELPLPAGIAMGGAVTPNGSEILGYTLDAAAGDTLDLTFTRLSGNLNLGLAVMSPDNQIVFQASLVTSQTLTTRFTLPSAGTYTIGVFRIDLMPPATPEATAFQIQAALNP